MKTLPRLALCVALVAPALYAQDAPTAEQVEQLRTEKAKLEAELEALRNAHQREVAKLEAESEHLAAKAKLEEQKLDAELAAQRAELQRLEAATSLAKAKLEQDRDARRAKLETLDDREKLREFEELGELKAKKERMELEAEVDRVKLQRELADAMAQKERIDAENERLSAELRKLELESAAERIRINAESNRLNFSRLQLDSQQAMQRAKLQELEHAIELRRAQERLKDVVAQEVAYAEAPFADGVLTITDRRISLNEPIITGTADYVCERIHFFNNQSAAPIFIVIDSCPGGSVMEGYRIVKAMQASKAPIHVVVKSFAASMAAIITTLADKSYAYPNAVILHHQMSTGANGNMTQIREQYEEAQEWAKRLMGPVCKKIGVAPEEWVKQMYAKNSTGDWAEFATEAQQLKWVGNICNEIREAGIVERPDGAPPRPWYFTLFGEVEVDAEGKPFRYLPRLGPYDFYWLHNRDNYWRTR
ncbi:MAG: ATP-dependent Clp protease proteolytic subunit [Planctomycetota bacterium]